MKKYKSRFDSEDEDVHEPLDINYSKVGYDNITVHKILLPSDYEEIETRLNNRIKYPEREGVRTSTTSQGHRARPELIVRGFLGNALYRRFYNNRVSLSGAIQRTVYGNNIDISSGQTQTAFWRRFCEEYGLYQTGWTVSRLEFAFQTMLPFPLASVRSRAISYKGKYFREVDSTTAGYDFDGIVLDDEPTLYADNGTRGLRWYNKDTEIAAKGFRGMLSNEGYRPHRIEKTYKKFPHRNFAKLLGRQVTMLDLDNEVVWSYFVDDLVKSILQIHFCDLCIDNTLPIPRKAVSFHADRVLVKDALMSFETTVSREHHKVLENSKGAGARVMSETRRSVSQKIERHCYFIKDGLSYSLLKRLFEETKDVAGSAWKSRRGKAILAMLERSDRHSR